MIKTNNKKANKVVTAKKRPVSQKELKHTKKDIARIKERIRLTREEEKNGQKTNPPDGRNKADLERRLLTSNAYYEYLKNNPAAGRHDSADFDKACVLQAEWDIKYAPLWEEFRDKLKAKLDSENPTPEEVLKDFKEIYQQIETPYKKLKKVQGVNLCPAVACMNPVPAGREYCSKKCSDRHRAEKWRKKPDSKDKQEKSRARYVKKEFLDRGVIG